MTPDTLKPAAEFDLPPGRLEQRKQHLVTEIAARRPRRLPRFALVPAAAASAAVVLLLVAPWQGRGRSVVDQALAAVGAGPVVHAVVEYSWPQDVVVDLATGAEQERLHRWEYWYDEERELLRVRYGTDGNEPADQVATGDRVGLDASLAGFVTQYRDALADGRARVVGDATVDGKPAKRIEFAPRGAGAVELVTVDAESYVPLRFYTTYRPNGRRSPEWRVATIESVPRDRSDFSPAKSTQPRPSVGEVSEGKKITLAEAERALGAPPLWLGPSFGGHALESVEHARTTAWLTDGSKASGVLVRLVYGRVRVSLARDAAGSYALGFGDAESPTPPDGSVAVTGDRYSWSGQLRQGQLAVMLSAPDKEQVLAAARALRPRP